MLKISKVKAFGAFVVAASVSTFSPAAMATSGTNTLSDVTVEQGTSFARIALNGTAIGGRPSCHNALYTTHYAFDISTDKGKAMLTTAMAALLSGKRVAATGLGGLPCTTVAPGLQIETLVALTIFS